MNDVGGPHFESPTGMIVEEKKVPQEAIYPDCMVQSMSSRPFLLKRPSMTGLVPAICFCDGAGDPRLGVCWALGGGGGVVKGVVVGGGGLESQGRSVVDVV